MVSTRKDGTSLVPVISVKFYEELCGDVTRSIIRETGNISILQRNRTYAFNWPTVNWYLEGSEKLKPRDLTWLGSDFVTVDMVTKDSFQGLENGPGDWFNALNPIRGAKDLDSPVTIDSLAAQSPTIPPRYLVLSGRVWSYSTLMQPRIPNRGKESVPAYLAEDAEIVENVSTQGAAALVKPGQNARFAIFKGSLAQGGISSLPERFAEYRSLVRWVCWGAPREGDMFVSLDPGSQEVLLRKAQENAFEVVGWGWILGEESHFYSARDRSVYPMFKNSLGDKHVWRPSTDGDPGPRRQFRIR